MSINPLSTQPSSLNPSASKPTAETQVDISVSKKITKILVANRGEIACRVFSTAKKLGIQTVAVFSDADVTALHVSIADEAIHIGGGPASESYLDIKKIIDAAKQSGANAIHPGYGFLSENANFAEACEAEGIYFIGPDANAIRAMGSKARAKAIMEKAKVPLLLGYHQDNQDVNVLKAAAQEIGYPVLLKAVDGGGGRGMRPVFSETEFEATLSEAKREAMASFGSDDMLIEKYLPKARHVEVQIFCDKHGEGVYLFDRDCSLQRRHQKVVEEAPAPNLSEAFRKTMGETAVRAAQAIHYSGAGTIEFLVEKNGSVENFYFMEMNTRLQVEHPVTECVSGQDLVEWQILVAAGAPLPKKQNELELVGHAIEVRIYAEDPAAGFCPSTGVLQHVQWPDAMKNVRVDTGYVEGDSVSPYYDAMLAKLICWGNNRAEAINSMQAALKQCRILGLKSNIAWLARIISSEAFIEENIHTQFIHEQEDQLLPQQSLDSEIIALCWFFICAKTVYERRQRSSSPWHQLHHWRMNQKLHLQAELEFPEFDSTQKNISAEGSISGATLSVTCEVDGKTFYLSGFWNGVELNVTINNIRRVVEFYQCGGQRYNCIDSASGLAIEFNIVPPDHGEADEVDSANRCVAPLNARIMEVLVSEGDHVEKGKPMIVLEAMKMEYTISADVDAEIEKVYFKQGDLVEAGAELLSFCSTE